MENKFRIIDLKLAKQRWIIGLILIIIITYVFFGFTKDVYTYSDSYKEQLIRFHVLANSDAPEDQQLKLKVRDRVIREMNPKFEQSKSLSQTRGIIKQNLINIENIAREVIVENGNNYTVKVTLEDVLFPTKNYGSITLPAGTYEALRIVIGEGQGANWWCVLFPPLCFIDVDKGLTTEKTKQELMNVLTEEEYNMIQTAGSDSKMPIKLKFKVVEILEYARSNFEKVVGMK